MSNVKQVHLLIIGDVTGVGYRAWAKQQALQLGVTGWVRNVGDGQVEALVQGERSVLEKFISLCNQGPDVAWVQQVDVIWQEMKEDMMEFEIRM